RGTDVAAGAEDPSRFVGTVDLLGGLRSLLGSALTIGINALRSALLFVLILCLLRVLLRRQWAAAVSFVLLFSLLNALPSGNTWADVARAVSFFTLFAFAVLRWGLTSIFVGVFAADLLLNTPAVAELSSWYAGGVVLFLAIPIALATWALYTSLAGRPGSV
ncbi:MAG TPA: hypothetical protein VLD67_15550, partial [Vicinamibacterales bacterium]|nr:hypothetical protein [Vicinamibacterales bacterium]